MGKATCPGGGLASSSATTTALPTAHSDKTAGSRPRSYQGDFAQARPATGKRFLRPMPPEARRGGLNVRKRLPAMAAAGPTPSWRHHILSRRPFRPRSGRTTRFSGRNAWKPNPERYRSSDAEAPNSGAGQLDALFKSLFHRNRAVPLPIFQLRRSNWFILSGTSGERQFYARFEQKGRRGPRI